VFTATHAFIASPIGLLLLFGWSVAFFYHLCSEPNRVIFV
jgi:succinate dehydrogenase / fumarate reductase, cytochrome b subunit